MMGEEAPMPAPKPVHRNSEPSDSEIYAAERYLDKISEDESLSPEEVRAIRNSIDEIRKGEMTLAEFERKYGL